MSKIKCQKLIVKLIKCQKITFQKTFQKVKYQKLIVKFVKCQKHKFKKMKLQKIINRKLNMKIMSKKGLLKYHSKGQKFAVF